MIYLLAGTLEVPAKILQKKVRFSCFKGLIEVLNRLEDYIKVHFSFEEALMTKYDYSEKDQHFTEHNELRYKILSTNLDYIEKSKDFYTETYTYLFNWLINHIMKIDKKLAAFLNEKNVSI